MKTKQAMVRSFVGILLTFALATVSAQESCQFIPPSSILPPVNLDEEVLFAKIYDTCPERHQWLVRVDHLIAPGVSEFIGPIGFTGINSMDFDRDGTFFALGRYVIGGPPYLITIDSSTGEGVLIGGPSTGASTSLAGDADGNLYGSHGGGDKLYQIDRETGLTYLVGSIDWDTGHQGSDFGPNGNYFMLTRSNLDSGLPPALLEIDPATGSLLRALEFTVDFGLGPESMIARTAAYDVSFSREGIMYASVSIDRRSWLLTVDLETGVGNPLGIMSVPDGMGGWLRVLTTSLAF
ncbi:MAG: hypothetical protein KJN98_01710, partial [Pontiella sp.]|nr:hypothetical protein [Pontiella sp.]